MIRIIVITVLFLFITPVLISQTDQPKLVVGIVVDQMRSDHLYKYQDRFSNGGFKRLIREGYNFKNTLYNYIPTYTAPGHASIYSGATPSTHGIIGNTWYQRSTKQVVTNIGDTNELIVGTEEVNSYGASPRNLLSSTITDQLRMVTQFKSKVISVSIKDRGAILPGGHTANAAYWHDWKSSPGYFISSSYYMEELPKWVSNFNKSGKSDSYLKDSWSTLYPIDSYEASAADDNNYERAIGGKTSPTFPYDYESMRARYKEIGAEFQLIWVSPAGNSLLTDFAIEAIKNEKLGSNGVTDFINISYSVPDIIGHTFGPQSVEFEDVILRLDRDIENLLNSLDATIGNKNYLLFLTSDHGSVPVTAYLRDNKLPGGIAQIPQYQVNLTNHLNSKYGSGDWIEYFDGESVYLNHELIKQKKLSLSVVQRVVADYLITLDEITAALTASDLQTQSYSHGINQKLQKGYHSKRSGDVLIILKPAYVPNLNPKIASFQQMKGTTHGSGYAYDSHVPMLWFGNSIPNGESVRKVSVIDIAPSLSMFLNIPLPSGSEGEPLIELFD
ncbi:alkaline phosphatase PafA [uncultured Eudoraea sp.]|uniref:alkaline phosphatase PafA n=1 Tax=uncultured Eudoraea sp. TaxID=1035614 RepID=UPI00262EF50D|nr:alkaline phosphatase PafA [uncultured Eudoraea sp.]